MLKYKNFNESRKNRNRRKNKQITRNYNAINKYQPYSAVDSKKMDMIFSDRFKYVVEKISMKGNAIAKDLLSLPNSANKYSYSYLDLTDRYDTISYLSSDKNLSEGEDKFKTNKRQHSKVYKVIKTILGNKFTKNEVSKFVTFYKQVYEQGPDKKFNREIDIVNKITEDTKKNIINWKEEKRNSSILKVFKSEIVVTLNKYILLELYLFKGDDKKNTFLSINFCNNNALLDKDKKKWYKTFRYENLFNFLEAFKDKYLENNTDFNYGSD